MVLRYASQDVRADRQIVMEAVRSNGLSLEFASGDLRGEQRVATEAVRQNGLSLQFASVWLRAEPDVPLEAMAQLGITPNDLLDYRRIVLEAEQRESKVFQLATFIDVLDWD